VPDGVDSVVGRPPGRAIPRLSTNEGFLGGMRTPGTAGEECRFAITGLPFGNLKFTGKPPANAPEGGDTKEGEVDTGTPLSLWEEFCRKPGGVPWRPRWKAFMRAWMSCETLRPLPLDVTLGGGLLEVSRFPKRADGADIRLDWIEGGEDIEGLVAGADAGGSRDDGDESIESGSDGDGGLSSMAAAEDKIGEVEDELSW
jgi:hypothetical protein